MGTPTFAVEILKGLLDSGYDVVAVFTNPDKPVGRKQIITQTEVKKKAIECGIKVFQPDKFTSDYVKILEDLDIDAIVVAAYGKILPKEVLDVPKLGCFNVHGSLLPKYRGAAPIQASIINCEKETGITIIKMTPRLDDGDILKMESVKIGINETFCELSEKLAKIGARLICDVLKDAKNNCLTPIPQDENKASYVFKLKKEMGKINFNMPAIVVHKLICGISKWPVAYCCFGEKKLKIYKSILRRDYFGQPGEILSLKKELIVACKEEAVQFCELQLEGKKLMSAESFLNGVKLKKGDFLK